MQLLYVVAYIALGSFLALGGCSWLPADGPATMDVRHGGQADPESLPYATVKLTPQVIDILATEAPSLSAAFADRRPPGNIRFGVGDVVSITVFEAGAGGLFIPSEAGVRRGNFVNIPNQRVDYSGNITMPYAPPIRAAGRTAPQVQKSIVEALKNRAIDPQVIVSLVEQRTSLISVLGEVNAPICFPANFEAERLLDALTRAGGPKGQGFDTWVMLERSGRRRYRSPLARSFMNRPIIYTCIQTIVYSSIENRRLFLFSVPLGAKQLAGETCPNNNCLSTLGEYHLLRPWLRPVVLVTIGRILQIYSFIGARRAS